MVYNPALSDAGWDVLRRAGEWENAATKGELDTESQNGQASEAGSEDEREESHDAQDRNKTPLERCANTGPNQDARL